MYSYGYNSGMEIVGVSNQPLSDCIEGSMHNIKGNPYLELFIRVKTIWLDSL